MLGNGSVSEDAAWGHCFLCQSNACIPSQQVHPIDAMYLSRLVTRLVIQRLFPDCLAKSVRFQNTAARLQHRFSDF